MYLYERDARIGSANPSVLVPMASCPSYNSVPSPMAARYNRKEKMTHEIYQRSWFSALGLSCPSSRQPMKRSKLSRIILSAVVPLIPLGNTQSVIQEGDYDCTKSWVCLLDTRGVSSLSAGIQEDLSDTIMRVSKMSLFPSRRKHKGSH